MNVTKTYTDASRYVAGAINLSSGYEFSKGKYSFRFQPYLQIPLKGIGVGTMRVMSAGVHFGLLYKPK